ncbi:MAG: nitrous oxide reductase family maturation protein NosD [Longimicrobiales bacterium]
MTWASGRPFCLFASALLAACNPGPEPISYGSDSCSTCHMVISDPRFGSEAVSTTGKIWKFDSVEDLASFALHPPEGHTLLSLWVSDFGNPGTVRAPSDLLSAEGGFYLISEALQSPMGLGIAAFSSAGSRDSAQGRVGGEAATWSQVLAFVDESWSGGSPSGVTDPKPQTHDGGDPDHIDGSAELVVDPNGPVTSVSAAIARATPGATIVVMPGVYEDTARLVIDKPLTLSGRPGAILDGTLSGQILEIHADSVAVRGLTFRNVASSYVEDRSAIKVESASDCTIEENRFEATFFGIYLANSGGCRIIGNELVATGSRESAAGNGIHLWYSTDVEIADNSIRGHRDGIYFEFVEGSRVTGNVSEENLRYGLHFMFSDDCTYLGNRFRDNGAGVAVMYTENVVMEDNDFAENWGNAAFGLLLKDIRDSRLEGNRFLGNSIGLYAEGANRLQVLGNDFRENGWAVKIMADTEDAEFSRNNFFANSFDLATNSRRTWSRFDGNYWDGYAGYDLDRDGVGDVPFRPVRLFTLLAERNEPSLVLLRSFLAQLLDMAEAVVPLLTPESLADNEPAMRPLPSAWGAS